MNSMTFVVALLVAISSPLVTDGSVERFQAPTASVAGIPGWVGDKVVAIGIPGWVG